MSQPSGMWTSSHVVHIDVGDGDGVLCGEPRWLASETAAKATCRRCLAALERQRAKAARPDTATVHIGSYRNGKLSGVLCGNAGARAVENHVTKATCKFCLKVFERMQASAARSSGGHKAATHARRTVGETLCGASNYAITIIDTYSPLVDCKRCLAALERQRAKAVRSNTESSAGRIPRTPGR